MHICLNNYIITVIFSPLSIGLAFNKVAFVIILVYKNNLRILFSSSSCIALAATTIVMMTEGAAAANAFRSDDCLPMEGLKSAQQYLAGYIDAHHDFIAGLGQKNLQTHHQTLEVYILGYRHGWSDAQRGILNSEC